MWSDFCSFTNLVKRSFEGVAKMPEASLSSPSRVRLSPPEQKYVAGSRTRSRAWIGTLRASPPRLSRERFTKSAKELKSLYACTIKSVKYFFSMMDDKSWNQHTQLASLQDLVLTRRWVRGFLGHVNAPGASLRAASVRGSGVSTMLMDTMEGPI